MAIWRKLIDGIKSSLNGTERADDKNQLSAATRYAMIDVEVGVNDLKIHDIGAFTTVH